MATFTLSPEQVATVLAPSKRYPESDYSAILSDTRSSGKAHGHIETLFPGVKPAHVVFMLKRLRGDAKDVIIDSHGDFGVCVIPAVKPATAKPKASKPAKAKPAASKPAKKRTKKSA